jgi:hypothetical protein
MSFLDVILSFAEVTTALGISLALMYWAYAKYDAPDRHGRVLIYGTIGILFVAVLAATAVLMGA